ncbi:MAG: sulfur carrier protein ThiS [Fibrobacter sp.]|jgi:thiamine biosynthesis protein ThiS|nr:sulfur carrier protein ThiS [Fibrobacter sp.]
MIEILYNKNKKNIAKDSSLKVFLNSLDLDRVGVAAAINEKVVARSAWGSTFFSKGDSLTVIEIAQGG